MTHLKLWQNLSTLVLYIDIKCIKIKQKKNLLNTLSDNIFYAVA